MNKKPKLWSKANATMFCAGDAALLEQLWFAIGQWSGKENNAVEHQKKLRKASMQRDMIKLRGGGILG